jgi:NADH:ubiquinone oxidoreductase subunit 3 (subunit A)
MVEVVFVVMVVMVVAVLVMVFMLVVLDFLSRNGKFITTYITKRPEYNHYHHRH